MDRYRRSQVTVYSPEKLNVSPTRAYFKANCTVTGLIFFIFQIPIKTADSGRGGDSIISPSPSSHRSVYGSVVPSSLIVTSHAALKCMPDSFLKLLSRVF